MTDEPVAPDPYDPVAAWRLHVLIKAGYPIVVAEQLAARRDIDLHQAVELVRQGCPRKLAAEILL